MNTQILRDALGTYLADNPWIFLLALWMVIWEGLALWRAAKKSDKVWFVVLLITNTFGLLEILYLIYTHYSEKRKPLNPIAPKDFTPPKNPNLP